MSIENLIGRYRPPIEQAIRSSLPPGSEVLRPIRYHFNLENKEGQEISGPIDGKLFRSTLFLTTAEGLMTKNNHSPESIMPVATALELLHNFTLIHDDIEDQDSLRRGRPTVWKIFGMSQAINSGDLLREMAIQNIHDLRGKGLKPDAILDMLEMFNQTTIRLAIGQAADISFEGETNSTIDSYMQMISGKTGAMIELSILLAAKLQGTDETLTLQLHTYATALGKMFQLQDDYLGIWGEKEKTGKSTDSDLSTRKNTYPVVHGLQTAYGIFPQTEKIKQLIDFYVNRKRRTSQRELNEIRRILEILGSKKATEGMIEKYRELALGEIANMNASKQLKADYTDMVHFLAIRDH